MHHRLYRFVLTAFVTLLFLLPINLIAEESPPPLAELWMMSYKTGHGSSFYAALEEHMKFRSEQGDPRNWQAYSPVLGDDLGRVAVRYCCFEWQDQDSYRDWSQQAQKVSDHFDEHVLPHVEKFEHYFESIDWKNSHWVEASGEYRLFAVNQFNLKPGQAAEFDAARDKLSQIAINQGWATDEHSWLWATTIGGKPQESIIIPHRNFASMGGEQDSFTRFLADQLGEDAAAAVLKQFSDATWSSSYQIWALLDDLSMANGD